MYRLASAAAILILAPSLFADEPIPGVTAQATSEQVKGLFAAQNLCKDTGLSPPDPQTGARKLTTNPYADKGCIWHSGYIAHGGDENPLVEFDLQKTYTVGRMHVWNHNSNPSRGFRYVSVLISQDGENWQSVGRQFQFAKAPGKDDYVGESYEFHPPIVARFIRFCCESTWRVGGNRELAGLGKVRFYAAPNKAEADPRPPIGAGVYPEGAGIVNVRFAPYNAKGDGTTDDTDAIQRAIDDHQGSRRIVLIPPGTYLLSKSLRYAPGKGYGYNNLRGVSSERTILKLRDGTFVDTQKPQPVLSLGFNGQPDGKWVHADWFNNNVGSFTIDTGKGNPGAIGLQFYSNNVGALRDVVIRSADGNGWIGLDLISADQNGPCLVKNVRIEGFRTGVRSGATVNSQTAEHVRISGATEYGWDNGGQCLSIRGLRVEGSGIGFHNRFGIVALIDSEFRGSGTASEKPAIRNGEALFARSIRTSGYREAIENVADPEKAFPGPKTADVDEWVSAAPLTLFPIDKPRSLNLPIVETPSVEWEEPAKWVNVRAFRKLSDPDDSAAFQRAIDSGATTIYFPAGGPFYFSTPIELRGKVRHVIGMFAGMRGVKGVPTWRIGAEGPKTIVLQDFADEVRIECSSNRTVVVKNGQGTGGILNGGGDLFLENVTADWTFVKGRAWARQFNNEREGLHILNDGATLWILGLKTERGGTLIESRPGATTELLGGLSYTTTQGKLGPMFVSKGAKVSYVIGEVCYSGDPYRTLIRQQRGEETKTLERGQAPLRPAFLQGSRIPLFVGMP